MKSAHVGSASTATGSGPAGARVDPARAVLLAELARIDALVRGVPHDAPIPAGPSPIADLARRLGLSPFERDVLLLAAAVELDGAIAGAVAEAQGGSPAPTFAFAMSVLPDPHWDALSPERPLRRRRLVRLGLGGALPARPLAVDEAMLHRIAGLGGGSLGGLVDRAPIGVALTPAQAEVADEVAAAVRAIDGPVLVRLTGADAEARSGVAAELAQALGGGTLAVRDAVAASLDPVDTAALLDREALVDARLVVTSSKPLLEMLEAEVVVTDSSAVVPGRTTLARTVPWPTPAEQDALWHTGLGGASLTADPALAEATRELAHHFRFSPRGIAATCAEWRSLGEPGADELRRLARDRARVGFGPLAQRIDPRARWDDLVLPDGQLEVLHDLERHVRHRARVHDDWGFAARGERGLGVSALFAGESGTGKTMAAEVVAGSLGLDLYRVDLAALVSKYIGETEKHLSDVFDAAEASGAVLLFDEADALFGKRSEVKDSHDRYANLEVAYLLQRMESYRGLAILTTNLRANVDRAFLRRIRFVVQFPFPDAAARAEIWRRVFPAETPTEGLDPAELGRMQLTGGSIRQVAISAAFAAADAGTPVRSAHVLRAAQLEAAKSDRTLTDAETGGLRRGGATT